MVQTLIIGYGNPLRGDDGFGWHTARRLQELIHEPGVEILALHQLTPELMETVSRARRVIFIDAAIGEEPGKVTVAAVETASGRVPAFTHFATPASLVEGAGALYGARPEAQLVTVIGLDFELGEELSEPVKQALDWLAGSKIRELLSNA